MFNSLCRQSDSGNFLFICLGCGEAIEVRDNVSPLDSLGCCSAECDAKVEAGFRKQLERDPKFRAQLENEGVI
jgi:hypothetical protein